MQDNTQTTYFLNDGVTRHPNNDLLVSLDEEKRSLYHKMGLIRKQIDAIDDLWSKAFNIEGVLVYAKR